MLGCFYYHIFNYTTISEYGKDFLKTEKNMVMDGNGNNLTYIDIFQCQYMCILSIVCLQHCDIFYSFIINS